MQMMLGIPTDKCTGEEKRVLVCVCACVCVKPRRAVQGQH